jgi:hypothetical protein
MCTTASTLVIGAGGFLGVGERNVAVPFDKVTFVASTRYLTFSLEQGVAMTRSRTYMHILITAAAAFALSACVVRPNQPGSNQYGSVSENTQADNMAPGPYYYRGTASNVAPMHNDASIRANVVQAISRVSGTGTTNLQVMTSNGVVTLRGVADNQAIAQSDVQAASQVPGVLRVDYDIQVLRR